MLLSSSSGTRTRLASAVLRLACGLGVAGALLVSIELSTRLFLGAPEPLPHVAQVSVAELVPDGAGMRLQHAADARQDILVAPKSQKPRVVTLGGSSVRHSWAVDPQVDFPHWLAERIPEVEVVNLGSPGQTTLGLRSNLAALAALQPDLIILYAGHNDFSQPVFQGQLGASQLWMLPLYRLASASWIYSALREPTLSLAPPAPDQRRGLVLTDDARALRWQQTTLDRYASNIAALVADAPAPVLLTTQLRNFDHPPSGLLVSEDNTTCRSAVRQVPLKPTRRAARIAAEVDELCGEGTSLGLWHHAHAAYQRDDVETAVQYFGQSLAADPIPLRAPMATDEVVRAVAANTGTPLVDLAGVLGPLSHRHLFDDSLHPSVAGAKAIARTLEPAVRKLLGRGAEEQTSEGGAVSVTDSGSPARVMDEM